MDLKSGTSCIPIDLREGLTREALIREVSIRVDLGSKDSKEDSTREDSRADSRNDLCQPNKVSS